MKKPVVLLLIAVAAAIVLALALHRSSPDDDGDPGEGDTSGYTSDGTFVGPKPERLAPKNLIVIVLGGVRRDAVSLGDEPEQQMPHLSRLAKRGVAFRQSTSAAASSVPAIASLLTGLHPIEHGCRQDGPGPKLLASIVTYAEALHTSFDYQTAAFSDVPWHRGGRNSVLQGFEAGSDPRGQEVRGEQPLRSGFWLQGGDEILKPWAATLDRRRPFFLLLHAQDASAPFGEENHPPATLALDADPVRLRERMDAVGSTVDFEPWEVLRLALTSQVGRDVLLEQRGPGFAQIAARYAWAGYRERPRPELAQELLTAYRDGLRWTDEGLGRLLPYLEAEGLLEDTLLVVCSDHGEAFGEHGLIGDGRQLDDELIRVPLVMHGPAPFATERVIDASVGVIDVLPTFFDWIGAPDIPQSQGRSLLPLLRGEPGRRPVVSEAIVTSESAGQDERRVLESVRTARWKYVVEYDVNAGYIDERLFDLQVDPGERTDLLTGDATLAGFELSRAFCQAIELTRDRVWDLAASIAARAHTPYSAGVATTNQPRPAPCGK